MKFSARLLVLLALLIALPVAAQDDSMTEGIGDDAQIAPPSIGADIPVTYFGPPPSSVQPELIGPYQLLKSGPVDLETATVTLPLYEGQMESGETVWFILTDTTDEANAAALGLLHSSKLTYANVGNAVRPARQEADGSITFSRGTVDFSPERSVTPGEAPNFFPPASVQAGAVGDEFYSPLMQVTNAGGAIYNAPMIAFNVDAATLDAFCEGNPDYSLVHDKVVSICPSEGTVTLAMTLGFTFGRPLFYLSMDANDPLPATLEGVTVAPGLNDVAVGGDDSAFSAVERIFVITNGPTGIGSPQRQGLNSAIAGEGSPLNVLGGIPTIATDYSPLWDMNVGEWTQEAIDLDYRSRVTEEFQILGLVQRGWLTGPGGSEYGSTGFIVNCPPVMRLL